MEKKIFIKDQTEAKEIQERIVLRKVLLQQLYKNHFKENSGPLIVNIEGDVQKYREVFQGYQVLRELGLVNYNLVVREEEEGNLILHASLTVKGILEYESL
ncbi:hypothetical protein [Lysinibacillus xylanilyticus]|uniref:hypothetical protein n=1 Tax=Lysinibacillus xylanilyticus TaxID=582475 RepID=UPI003D035842